MLETQNSSENNKKKHSVQSSYRCLTTHIRNILEVGDIIFLNPVCQDIKGKFQKLTLKQRKKGNIKKILHGSKEQFDGFLGIPLHSNVDQTSLKNAQEEFRRTICQKYENLWFKLWELYQEHLEKSPNQKKTKVLTQTQKDQKTRRRKENCQELKKLIDYIIIDDQLALREERISKNKYEKHAQEGMRTIKQFNQSKNNQVSTFIECQLMKQTSLINEQLHRVSQNQAEDKNLHKFFKEIDEYDNSPIQYQNLFAIQQQSFFDFIDGQEQGRVQIWNLMDNFQELSDIGQSSFDSNR